MGDSWSAKAPYHDTFLLDYWTYPAKHHTNISFQVPNQKGLQNKIYLESKLRDLSVGRHPTWVIHWVKLLIDAKRRALKLISRLFFVDSQ